MKRLSIIAVVAVCILLVTSCGSRRSIDVRELAEKINTDLSFAEPLSEIDSSGAEKYFYINPNDYEDIAAYISTNAVCDEFVIIKTKDTNNTETKLRQHIDRLKSEYQEYRPSETHKLDEAFLQSYKDTVVMIISKDSVQAKSLYDNYLKK